MDVVWLLTASQVVAAVDMCIVGRYAGTTLRPVPESSKPAVYLVRSPSAAFGLQTFSLMHSVMHLTHLSRRFPSNNKPAPHFLTSVTGANNVFPTVLGH